VGEGGCKCQLEMVVSIWCGLDDMGRKRVGVSTGSRWHGFDGTGHEKVRDSGEGREWN